ncbi:MAG: hypothetical protein Q9166_003835 [cf. Caloplaca sp. 2 TL-2023]
METSGSRALELRKKSTPRKKSNPTLGVNQSLGQFSDPDSDITERSIIRKDDAPLIQRSLAPREENIQSTFLIVNFLDQIDFGRKSLLGMWDTMPPSNYPAKRALEVAFFGRFHGRKDFQKASSLWYGKALNTMATDLMQPQEMWSTSTIRSAIILFIYEALNAMNEQKRSFLGQQDWLHVPWAAHSGQKSHLDKLMDIQCILPGLFEARKRLSIHKRTLAETISSKDERSANDQLPLIRNYHLSAIALATRCERYLGLIRAWKAIFDEQTEPITILKSSRMAPSDPDYPFALFGPPLGFQSLDHSYHYWMYYSILRGLLTLAYEFHYEASDQSTSTHNALNSYLFITPDEELPRTENDGLLVQRYRCSVEICRSVPYSFSVEPRRCGGAYMIMVPLIMTRRTFGDGDEEAKYIDGVLGSLGAGRGII